MSRKWINSKRFSGVRWIVHETRKHGVRYDRCFGYRFMHMSRQYEGLLGWESEGWTEESSYLKRQEYFENVRNGRGPTSPGDEAEISRKNAEAEKTAQISFEEYFENRYLPEAKTRKKEKTIRVERQHVRDWLGPQFVGKPMKDITADDIEKVKLAILDAGRAPRTAQHVLAVFRLVWNHARKRKVVEEESPTRVVSVGKIKNARTRFLEADEARKLLGAVRERDENAYRFTLAALYTGARLGELAALTWSGVNLRERTLTLDHTKTGDTRMLPMATPLLEELKRMSEGTPDAPVFTDSRGKPWRESPWAFRQAVKDLKLNEGRTDRREIICFHSLRHSAASMMLAAGVDVRTIQTHFGWSTLAMLQRYTHSMDESKRAAVNSLEMAMQKKEGKVVPFTKALSTD